MEQYIKKSVLIAEIKRLLAFYLKEIEDNKEDPWAMDIAKRDILQEILSFLDSLEVKEVDINKEISQFIDANFEKATIGHKLSLRRIAKHFFELGLKAKDWKPSDEQMKILEDLVEDNNQRFFYTTLKSLYNDLKKLKEE